MILSHKEIEEIAAAVTKDFNEFFFGPDTDGRRLPRGTPIDQFAREYLGLNVSFAYLSEDGSICGLTAYTDTEYIVEDRGFQRKIPLHRNEVLMDRNFIEPSQIRKLCGKRRFTLAHECAHQILFQMETDKIREACRRKYSARTAYSLRELKTREDWNEWQANVLGAAILMPQREIDLAVAYYARGRKLVSYDGTYAYWDKVALDMICQQFGVSKTAAVIRLRRSATWKHGHAASTTILWRCGHEEKHSCLRAFTGDAGENPQGAMRHCQPEDAYGEMSILWA